MNSAIALCLVVSSLNITEEAKKTACDNMPHVINYSKAADIDPVLILSMMYVESRFQKNIVSRSGACGLMQLIPKWNKEEVNGKNIKYSCKEIMEPERNIRLGVAALKRWHKTTKSMDRSLCGYNAGNICRKKIKNPSKFRYVRAVRSTERRIRKALSKYTL